MKPCIVFLGLAASLLFAQQPQYDLLLQGGHVIDAKTNISAVRDVAIQDGKIAAVAEHIDPATALKTVNAKGLYVTPGLIDIHVHVYASTGEAHSYAGDNSVFPDGFTFRVGVTTVADAGCAGCRNFEDFKEHIIDRSKTRVLAFLNIVGAGMRGRNTKTISPTWKPQPAAEMAQKHPGLIIGIKTAHYCRTGVDAGGARGRSRHTRQYSGDGGFRRESSGASPHRPADQKLRPGDIYTHCYSGLRHELDDPAK